MKVRLKVLPEALRGVAWPPSVRAVRCPLKWGNEQDLYLQLLLMFNKVLCKDCLGNKEEGVGNGRPLLPEPLGLQARNNGKYNELQLRKEKLIFKICLSLDWALKLKLMTSESLVIGRHQRPVNMSILLGHTARQTNQVIPRWGVLILRISNLSIVRGVKSTQGICRGTCRWITSFLK